MEVDKLMNVINGMLHMSEKQETPDDWTIDFLNHVKSALEQQKEEINAYQETIMLNSQQIGMYQKTLKYYADRGFNKAKEALE